MTRAKSICGALALCVAAADAAALGAQQPPADTTARDSVAAALSCAPNSSIFAPHLADTTIRIAVADSHWQRTNYSAGVAFGASGRVHGSAPWNTCAGASVHFGSVTIDLHNVNVLVRLHSNVNVLQSIGHASPDSLPYRNGTAPSRPPRR